MKKTSSFGWYYAPFKVKYMYKGKKYSYYSVREVFPKYGYTNEDIAPVGNSKEELINILEMMLKDIKHFPVRTITKRVEE